MLELGSSVRRVAEPGHGSTGTGKGETSGSDEDVSDDGRTAVSSPAPQTKAAVSRGANPGQLATGPAFRRTGPNPQRHVRARRVHSPR